MNGVFELSTYLVLDTILTLYVIIASLCDSALDKRTSVFLEQGLYKKHDLQQYPVGNIEAHIDKDFGTKNLRNEIPNFCLYLAICYVQLDVIDSFGRKFWPRDCQTCFLLSVFLQVRQTQLSVFLATSSGAKDKKEGGCWSRGAKTL